jgi:hypothetical protein
MSQSHNLSSAQTCRDHQLTADSVSSASGETEKADECTRSVLKLFSNPVVNSEVQMRLRTWSSYFSFDDVTSATADCSVYLPRFTPLRPAFKIFPPAFFHSHFPGMPPSPIVNSDPPSYYQTAHPLLQDALLSSANFSTDATTNSTQHNELMLDSELRAAGTSPESYDSSPASAADALFDEVTVANDSANLAEQQKKST